MGLLYGDLDLFLKELCWVEFRHGWPNPASVYLLNDISGEQKC
jgi:hypothetical protein